ncbi:HupE/UreJ family protein [Rhizobium leucaenae]|uniref:Hydrogenase/urease accessory protein HupE n=1 Tax=Rhizobium leucaenae TaxID=29450 RepID=A0A7W6ZQ98_9HYPH|nr:HupE/UreJ family protein [Rhizobium leucaenae]MBB4566741.1 hydrogenase/urease accessory protein HupE [Rhizobium leucaenae]MBB6301365.1 hydrogenase/urease accessory protein HupE [Rhizobium leucaenae]
MSKARLARFLLALKFLGLLTLLSMPAAFAHEVRPAYLQLHEERPGEFVVLWKVPMQGDMRLALEPQFSGKTEASTAVARDGGGAEIRTWTLRAPELRGQTLTIDGLEATMTDALVRVEYLDGTSWTGRFTAREPSAVIPSSDTAPSVAGVYLSLGIEHILFGVDHLLFVLALLIITRGSWLLVKTVTAFTIAHSITLALATLGFVHVPQAPVEATIALSIVFVAAEIVRRDQGKEGIAARAPWVVAFCFGLLHGLGFAGALSEIGLPEGHIPLALLFFNLGVEAGQLIFVGAVLSIVAIVRRTHLALPSWVARMPAYAIGSLAMFWTIQRVAMF